MASGESQDEFFYPTITFMTNSCIVPILSCLIMYGVITRIIKGAAKIEISLAIMLASVLTSIKPFVLYKLKEIFCFYCPCSLKESKLKIMVHHLRYGVSE